MKSYVLTHDISKMVFVSFCLVTLTKSLKEFYVVKYKKALGILQS